MISDRHHRPKEEVANAQGLHHFHEGGCTLLKGFAVAFV